MVTSQDVIVVDENTVACDGGVGSAGHPRVFLALKDGKIVCPYCSKTFMNNTPNEHPIQPL